MAATQNEKYEEITIPRDITAKKSKHLVLKLNGKKLKLERGKTHKVPAAYAKIYHQKQAFAEQGEIYKDKNSV